MQKSIQKHWFLKPEALDTCICTMSCNVHVDPYLLPDDEEKDQSEVQSDEKSKESRNSKSSAADDVKSPSGPGVENQPTGSENKSGDQPTGSENKSGDLSTGSGESGDQSSSWFSSWGVSNITKMVENTVCF